MITTFRFFEYSENAGNMSQARSWTSSYARQDSTRYRFLFGCNKHSGFDQGNYQDHPYRVVEMSLGLEAASKSYPGKTDKAPDGVVHLDCKLIKKGKSVVPANKGELFFITACRIAAIDKRPFLQQFEAASEYIKTQPGFVRFRLYESLSETAVYRFINVAQWRSLPEFVSTFQSDGFKKLIKGGFDQTSRIIMAKALSRH